MSVGQILVSTQLLLVLDLLGTFAFALNGALTAVRAADVDLVGVVTLGVITAIGGGTIRDVLLGAVPPSAFSDWRYLAVAGGGSLLAFLFSRWLRRLRTTINVMDAAGLGLFAVTGATKALALGAGPVQAILLGTVTAVGGGTVRDVLVRRVPSVLSGGLYAIPAAVGATVVVVLWRHELWALAGIPVSVGAAALVFVIRMLGLRFGLNAPRPLEEGQGLRLRSTGRRSASRHARESSDPLSRGQRTERQG